jgi:hypothetical protein
MSYESYDVNEPIWNNIETGHEYKAHNRAIQFEWSPKIAWWFPTVEVNFSMKEIGIYILCLSIYITWAKNGKR